MGIVDFFKKASELKYLKRTGWIISGVKNPESVGDHTFMVSLMAYIYALKLGTDAEKVLKMSIIHDICEAYSGDIPNRKGVSSEEKLKKEKEGFERIVSSLPYDIRLEMTEIWNEFLEQKTKEAQLVRDVDKLDMCLQALKYSKIYGKEKFMEFFKDCEKSIKTEMVRKDFEKIKNEFESSV